MKDSASYKLGFITAFILSGILIYGIYKITHKDEPVKQDVVAQVEEQSNVEMASVSEVQEPEPVPEPKSYDYTVYYEGRELKCVNAKLDNCGINLEDCSDGYTYYCMHNVKQITGS